MGVKFSFIFLIFISCTLSAMDNEESLFVTVEFGCKICLAEDSKDKLINAGCNQHDYCESCLKQYIHIQLQNRATSIKCPAAGCKTVLNPVHELFDQKQLVKNKNIEMEALIQQSDNSYVWQGLFKGFLGYIFCCFNCCGRVSFSDIEVCPYCKQVFQFTSGCNSIYHKECNHVFLKNSQLNVPCYDTACGCYFPNPIACCCSFTYTKDGDTVSCNTCPSCWCIDI
jgi:hypothetical protein